ncbi:GDSL-type esterase/lipase family protein [Paenibacillus cymbidii]|uniref:GDSL-type esterase/lipase family protein n=1 Tax=Paenibacillus cymbidii TaxID=1639034 RepID=UPI00108198B1|nr:GDSL-type esterase/lipase family protein [Paenibacillus cymbidii]
MKSREEVIKPGRFGTAVAADQLRGLYDKHNEVLVCHEVPVDIVFIGDSITLGWNVCAYFGRTGRFVVNRGIGGDISQYARKRFEADVLQLKPKLAVIKIGVNNTFDLDHWVPGDRREPADIRDRVVSDVAAMIAMAQEAGIVPVVCSVLPTVVDVNANTDRRNALIAEINAGLRLATEAAGGGVYVDYHARLTGPDGRTLRPELAEDGVHLNVHGYDIMAAALRETLAEHGLEI